MKAGLLCGLALAASLVAPRAWATATLTITVVDDPGVGFNDTTAATPVGGNTGTTLGQQRLIAFQAAADAWGRILESSVPIVIEASFAPLDCINGMAVEGHAGPYTVNNYPGLPTTGEYPTALANKILGKDISPTYPDITAEFNSDMGSCIGKDWYYGLDGNAARTQSDLLTVVMHELGHGLGFTTDVDPSTGALVNLVPSVFASHVLDNKSGKHFGDMTDDERATALTNVRQLVFDGQRTDAVTARFLAKGRPSLQLSPAQSGFSGVVGEANFGHYLADISSVSGSVISGSVPTGCTSSVNTAFSGSIALIYSPTNCSAYTPAYAAQLSGATAVLFAYNQSGSPPPYFLEVRTSDLTMYDVTIPTLAVTLDDANLIKGASGITATMSADKSKSVGADDAGHPFLFASKPIQSGSTGPHWDPIVRPDLIMEPVEAPNPVMYLDMERAVMWDIGWTGNCGNGTVDSGEACDGGAANSDYFPDACRLDCTKAKCGDGVVDSGEQCDPGGNGKLGDPNCDASCHSKSGGTGGAGGGNTGKGGAGAGGVGGTAGSSGKGGAAGMSAGGAVGAGGFAGSPGSGGSSAKGGAGGSAAGGSAGAGSGGTSAKGGASGSAGRGNGGTVASGGSAGSSETGGSSGSAGGSSGTNPGGKSSGCGCHTGRGDLGPGASMMVVGLGLALWLRRRRRLCS